MFRTEKRTIFFIDNEQAIEIGGRPDSKCYVTNRFYSAEQLRDLAEAAAQAADFMDLIADAANEERKEG